MLTSVVGGCVLRQCANVGYGKHITGVGGGGGKKV